MGKDKSANSFPKREIGLKPESEHREGVVYLVYPESIGSEDPWSYSPVEFFRVSNDEM